MCKKGAKKGSATTGLSIVRRLCLAMIITSLSLKKGSKERQVSCSFLTGSMGSVEKQTEVFNGKGTVLKRILDVPIKDIGGCSKEF